jgi:hypothetical protein
MRRREFMSLLGSASASPLAAGAQQPVQSITYEGFEAFAF